MPLFTSSSRVDRWQPFWHFAFGTWATLALIAMAALVRPAAAARADIVLHQDPSPWGSFYLAHDRGGHIDHHVLYHGIDAAALERMRAAEVLFLGNSRLMFALESRIMRALSASLGRDYYVLGFGHEEQDVFPLRVIREHDLRPSLVVVNADSFFASDQSEWAARVVGESDFDAWKVMLEGEIAHRVRRVLHRVVPHYVDLRRGQREVVLYRARRDGTWFVGNDFGRGVRFEWPAQNDTRTPTAQELRAAERFKGELDARGARLVLWVVPAPGVSLHHARALAAHLSVPLIVPDAGEVRTIDNSHLSYASAARVAASLLTQLAQHLP